MPDTAATLRRSAETHRLIQGRRWRISDPALDGVTRQMLVDELMSARRAVKDAVTREDSSSETAARRRVHDAKVALGERGPKWWEPMSAGEIETRVAALVRAAHGSLGELSDAQARRTLRLDADVR